MEEDWDEWQGDQITQGGGADSGAGLMVESGLVDRDTCVAETAIQAGVTFGPQHMLIADKNGLFVSTMKCYGPMRQFGLRAMDESVPPYLCDLQAIALQM